MKRYLWLLIYPLLLLSSYKSYADCELTSKAKVANLYLDLNNFKLSLNTDNTKSIYVTTFSAAQMANAMGISIEDPIFSCEQDNESLTFGQSAWNRVSSIRTPHGTGGLEIIPNKLYFYFTISDGIIGEKGYPQAGGSDYLYNLGTRKELTWKDIGNINLYLYKTGAIDTPGRLTGGVMFILSIYSKRRIDLIQIRNPHPYDFKATGCMTMTSTPTVNFGSVHSSLFKGKGSTAGNADFNIAIKCTEGLKPTIIFSGQENPSDTSKSVIRLDDSSDTNTAKGVGVQILYNNTPVIIGESLFLGNVIANNDHTFPFTAHYYQTGDRITGGKANATAHFTVQYE
ncbi:fimbrial protein [Photorhabdus sp. CRCIA-P01]|uniref:fimbrial protein n=1 Tax=Photorhabdus sp. CRCIA-P01 TaxID=2019570 RepID=UPI000E59F21F|nr:fimbrial protein [Photorhabdus sp. CRCIA-P01]